MCAAPRRLQYCDTHPPPGVARVQKKIRPQAPSRRRRRTCLPQHTCLALICYAGRNLAKSQENARLRHNRAYTMTALDACQRDDAPQRQPPPQVLVGVSDVRGLPVGVSRNDMRSPLQAGLPICRPPGSRRRVRGVVVIWGMSWRLGVLASWHTAATTRRLLI